MFRGCLLHYGGGSAVEQRYGTILALRVDATASFHLANMHHAQQHRMIDSWMSPKVQAPQ